MTAKKSVTKRKIILGRRPPVNIGAEDIQSEELRKSRIREEHIVVDDRSDQEARKKIHFEDPATLWYFIHV